MFGLFIGAVGLGQPIPSVYVTRSDKISLIASQNLTYFYTFEIKCPSSVIIASIFNFDHLTNISCKFDKVYRPILHCCLCGTENNNKDNVIMFFGAIRLIWSYIYMEL